MRIPSSSSLLLATLAISTSSPALAAPVPEANTDGGLTSSNSGQQLSSSGSQANTAHGRRGSVSGVEQKPLGSYKRMSLIHSRQLENRQLGINALGGLTHSVGDTLNKLLHARDEDVPASDVPAASSSIESAISSSSATPTSSTTEESSASATDSQPSSTQVPLEARQLGLGALLEPLMPVVNSLPEPVPQLVGTVIKVLARDEESVRNTETTAPIMGRRFAQPRAESSSAVPTSTSEAPATTSASSTCGETVGAASFGEYAVPMAQNVLPVGMQQLSGMIPNLVPGNLIPGNLIPSNLIPGNLIPGSIPIAGGILSPIIPNAPYNTPVGNNPGQFIPGGYPPPMPGSYPPLFGYDAEDQPVASASSTADGSAAPTIA